MSSTNKLRGKIHSGVTESIQPPLPVPYSGGSLDLTIEIPKPLTSQRQFSALRHKSKTIATNTLPDLDAIAQVEKTASDGEFTTYRDKLLDRLGPDYEGVEKYRLEQDEARERHWKRWGPYLSERQWVRSFSSRTHRLNSPITGHCP